MPQFQFTTHAPHAPLPIDGPTGPVLIPRIQFRCFLRLPGVLWPRDAILDTGAPFTYFPEEVWRPLAVGVDYEWLPFPAGYSPPRVQTAGWNFAFRFARILRPLGVHDGRTELTRDGVIVQFADSNPPIPPGSQKPAIVIVGLWGGILEGTAVRISTDAASGHTVGTLEW